MVHRMTLIDQIRAVAGAYCAARGLSRSRVSTIVFGDGQKLDQIEGGADLTTRRYEAALRWFAANWPEGAPWPRGVPRPKPAETA